MEPNFDPKDEILFMTDHVLWDELFCGEFKFEYRGYQKFIVLNNYFFIEDWFFDPPLGGTQKKRKLLQIREPFFSQRTEEERFIIMFGLLVFLKKYHRPVREVFFFRGPHDDALSGYYFREPVFLPLFELKEKAGEPYSEFFLIQRAGRKMRYDLHEFFKFILHY